MEEPHLDEEPASSGKRQRGQGMVEYALILVGVALVVIIILGVLGQQVSNMFSNVSSGLDQ